MANKVTALAFCLAIAGCSTTQIYRNPSSDLAGGVQVLYSTPQRAYESLGIVSAKRYKPGWSDPTVADAVPQLQSAAQQLGADAIVVHQSQDGSGNRFIRVEAEAIRYTDKPAVIVPPSPSDCASCGKLGH